MKPLYLALLLLAGLCCAFAAAAGGHGKKIGIVFIGNSVTEGSKLKTKPPTAAAQALEKKGYRVRFANCGMSGSTSVGWLPGTNRHFRRAVAAADTLRGEGTLLVFSISLGTNDSAVKGPLGAPVSPAQYQANLRTITDSLFARYPGCIVVLQRPLWYSPSTHNSAVYLQEGLDRLTSYAPCLEELAKENPSIYKGDWKAYDVFRKHYLELFEPEKGNSGTFYLHPNQKGGLILGGLWAAAIDKAQRKAAR